MAIADQASSAVFWQYAIASPDKIIDYFFLRYFLLLRSDIQKT